MSIAVTLALAFAVLAVTVFLLRRERSDPRGRAAGPASAGKDASGTGDIPYSTDAIEGVRVECWKLGFKAPRFDYQIFGEHATVLERIGSTVDTSVHQRDYFPRRPMLLPKLLQTLNDTDSSRQDLVKLLLEDPALTGSVLKRANSAFYRVSPEPVESLDRAVVMLGVDGLKRIMATAILQPVFRQPKGYFENFATVTWDQAQRAAVSAEVWANKTAAADPFVAQLLALLGPLAHLVIFRIATEKYREMPNVLPRAEVFVRGIQAHAPRVARLIAATWELSDSSLAALDAQAQRISPPRMAPLAQGVYFGGLSGMLGLAVSKAAYPVDSAHAILAAQGLDRELAAAMWKSCMALESEAW